MRFDLFWVLMGRTAYVFAPLYLIPFGYGFAFGDPLAGSFLALGVLTALFQGNRDFAPSLVGIEEPETALHPAASAALREALTRASKQTQIIVTSHSPDLLDDTSIPADTVLAVVADQSNTHIASLNEASRDSMQKHLFSAGELLRLDQLQPDPNELEHQTRHQASLFNELPS